MVSEYDLPCTDCGHDLTRARVDGVQVAECPNCGTRHYPESALSAADGLEEPRGS